MKKGTINNPVTGATNIVATCKGREYGFSFWGKINSGDAAALVEVNGNVRGEIDKNGVQKVQASKRRVQRDVEKGNWEPHLSTFSFNDKGGREDGYNRLCALRDGLEKLSEEGVQPAKALIYIRIVPEKTAEHPSYDSGKTRVSADFCTIKDKDINKNWVSRAIDMLWYAYGHKPSDQHVFDFITKHKEAFRDLENGVISTGRKKSDTAYQILQTVYIAGKCLGDAHGARMSELAVIASSITTSCNKGVEAELRGLFQTKSTTAGYLADSKLAGHTLGNYRGKFFFINMFYDAVNKGVGMKKLTSDKSRYTHSVDDIVKSVKESAEGVSK
ncbi:MAG: hypothetical protein ACR2NF_06010 [Pirellulales bacterium]